MRRDRWRRTLLAFFRRLAPGAILLLMAAQPSADTVAGHQWRGPSLPVKRIVIRVDEAPPDGIDWQRAAAVLVRLEPGDELSPQRLEAARQTLAAFASVAVAIDPLPDGAVVTFDVRPYRRIKSITIHGTYPLFEKDVRTVMTVASGDIFLPADMPEQERLIAERYRAEGYIDPRVRIEWAQEAHAGHYLVDVTVEKGGYYTPGEVKLHGNRAFGDAEIVGRLKTWRVGVLGLGFGRFVPGDFDSDIANLTTFYRKKGFADVAVSAELTA